MPTIEFTEHEKEVAANCFMFAYARATEEEWFKIKGGRPSSVGFKLGIDLFADNPFAEEA